LADDEPTTMAGVVATLDYAASTSARDDDRSVLSDWDPPIAGDPGYELVKQFPAMIATALRQIVADKVL
jgi:hypothetical protein